MKDIVSLKKILNNETVLQIHVRIMPRFSIDAYSFDVDNDMDSRIKHQQQCLCKAKICTLHDFELYHP